MPIFTAWTLTNKVDENDPYFYLGVLNSKLFWFFIKNTSTSIRGDAYRLLPQLLVTFAFPAITKENRKHHNTIAGNVREIMRLMCLAEQTVLDTDKNTFNMQITDIEKENDGIVCRKCMVLTRKRHCQLNQVLCVIAVPVRTLKYVWQFLHQRGMRG